MKKNTLLIAVGCGVALAGAAAAALQSQPEGDAVAPSIAAPTLVLNITSGKDDKHAVTMAYALAGHALDDGRAVVLFFNVHAPQAASKHIVGARFADHPPLDEMLAKLIKRGARGLVCPMCAKAEGVSEDELLPGLEFATRESLFSNLGPNSHVFTY